MAHTVLQLQKKNLNKFLYMSSGTELFNAMLTASRKFKGGDLMISQTVDRILKEDLHCAKFFILSLTRHLVGDWGDVGSSGIESNNQNVLSGGKLVSIYNVPQGLRRHIPISKGDLVIVTEANRKETLIMLYGEWEDADYKQTVGSNLKIS